MWMQATGEKYKQNTNKKNTPKRWEFEQDKGFHKMNRKYGLLGVVEKKK